MGTDHLSSVAGEHFTSLHHALAFFRKDLALQPGLKRRMQHLNKAASFVRHFTPGLAAQLKEQMAQLRGPSEVHSTACPSSADSGPPVGPSEESDDAADALSCIEPRAQHHYMGDVHVGIQTSGIGFSDAAMQTDVSPFDEKVQSDVSPGRMPQRG